MARTKTSKAWMHEHVTDPYVRRAKQEGYRSRAAYKLIEMLEMEPVEGVAFIRGDFSETETLERLEKELAGRRIDLVISDMAPNISGVGLADQARSIGLAELAFDFACDRLKPGGSFLVKLFQGSGIDEFRKQLAGAFSTAVVRKPKASRGRSSELYLLARGRRPSA